MWAASLRSGLPPGGTWSEHYCKNIFSARKIYGLEAALTFLDQRLQKMSSPGRHEGNAASPGLLDVFSVFSIDFSFSRTAKAWEHERERGGFLPSPRALNDESQQLWATPYRPHVKRNWAGDSPLVRDRCENRSVLWGCLGNTLSPTSYHSVSSHTQLVLGVDNRMTIVRVQFQCGWKRALFRVDFPFKVEICCLLYFLKFLKSSANYEADLLKHFFHIRETEPYKAKVCAGQIQWFCFFDGEKLLLCKN